MASTSKPADATDTRFKATRPEWIFDGSEIEDTFGYGERAVDFLRRLKHPKSASGDFELPLFWERIVRRIYGPCYPNKRRQVKTVFILLPRGARKTTMGAGLALLHTVGWERVPGGQAMVAASAEEDARIAYDEAVGIVGETEWLQSAMKPTESVFYLEHKKSKATFRALASGGKGKLGKTPNFVLADELINWEGENSRRNWQAIRTGLNKVPNTLLVIITQAGRGQENLAYELLTYARKVQSGAIHDPNFLPVLFESHPDDDWQDEELWHMVNPGLAEGYPDIDGLRTMAREAQERPSDRDNFRQFHLNCWLDYSASPFVSMPIYDEGNFRPDLDEMEANQTPCYLGVDLSSTSDLTAVVAAWGDRERGYAVHPWFFLPKDNILRKAGQDGVNYAVWEEQGLITLTEGNVVDFHAVEAAIEEICARFNVREIAFDPHLARNSLNNLQDKGLPVVEFRQGWVSMSPAINELERAILARQFQHGGHPILRWHFDNIAIRTDTAGNRSFHKGKSKDRIDGAVATAMAVARCAAGETNISSYDTFEGDMDDWSYA
ncbi:terminase large subunit [Agrobacterium pusense]|uniref:terminase large subunit n=1 Tax=Agrobacterium pusense TaxID=648995 RepID=UPI001AE9932C|nr:terminase TerL endonuclease subunit [Agrobacterium pusense]MBP2611418.1 phage terminase large subunit-like protein [Agrobacterium pusense]